MWFFNNVVKPVSGTAARIQFYLYYYNNVASLANAIRNLAYLGGSTNMAQALRYARTWIFNPSYGDRADVPNVIILVSGGQPDSQAAVLDEVRMIKDLGITVIGIGVTTSVSDYIIRTCISRSPAMIVL